MDAKRWLQKALQELTALTPDAHKNPADAWRAVTLLARLLASPIGPLPPSSLSQSLQELIEVAGFPNSEDILDMVFSGLESDTDAWGQILDGLIDADDALCVLALVGDDKAANELAARVAALVSLYPERVMGLSAFAQMRLESVRDDFVVTDIWRAVQCAPVFVLADALPTSIQHQQQHNLTPRDNFSVLLPEQIYQAAAADSGEDSVEFVSQDLAVKGWIYSDEGQMILEVRGLLSSSEQVEFVAEQLTSGVELARIQVSLKHSGKTATASLGAWAGPTNLLHKLLSKSGLSSDKIHIYIRTTNE